MGIGGISVWQLLIILVIVLLIFGTKRLRNIGSDLGNALKGFRGAMREGDQGKGEDKKLENSETGEVIDGEVSSEAREKDKDKEKEKV